MNALELLKTGSKLLKTSKIQSCILDAEILLSKTLNKPRENLLVNLDQIISDKEVLTFKKYLKRRAKNEPIAYIIEEKEFWSKKFFVNKDTLIPRPETELLVNKLLEIYKEKKITILDIGTGSGCIILSLLTELTSSFGVGIDISNKAILVAKKNASNLKLFTRVKFLYILTF